MHFMFGRISSHDLSSLCPGYIIPLPPPSPWSSTHGSFLLSSIAIHLRHPFRLWQDMLSTPFSILSQSILWMEISLESEGLRMAMPHPILCNSCLEPAKFEVLFTGTDGSSNRTSSVVRWKSFANSLCRFYTCHGTLSRRLMRFMAFGRSQYFLRLHEPKLHPAFFLLASRSLLSVEVSRSERLHPRDDASQTCASCCSTSSSKFCS